MRGTTQRSVLKVCHGTTSRRGVALGTVAAQGASPSCFSNFLGLLQISVAVSEAVGRELHACGRGGVPAMAPGRSTRAGDGRYHCGVTLETIPATSRGSSRFDRCFGDDASQGLPRGLAGTTSVWAATHEPGREDAVSTSSRREGRL